MLLLLLASAACGGTGASESAPQGDPPTSEADECGRVEAAARSSLVFFEVMGEMGEDCAQGDPLACNPANYVIAPLAGILYAPMGFLIGLTSEDVERYYCARAKAASGPKGSGAPKAPSPIEKTAEFELWRKAAGGNAQAQYDVASQLDAQSDPASREASRYWLCLAAQQGHAAAQGRMGDHRHESAQPQPGSDDLIEAYVWYELSADSGDRASSRRRGDLARRMPPAALAEAERRAATWQGNIEACRPIALITRPTASRIPRLDAALCILFGDVFVPKLFRGQDVIDRGRLAGQGMAALAHGLGFSG